MNRLTIKFFLTISRILQAIFPLLGACYLITWVFYVVNAPFYPVVESYFGSAPEFFDGMFPFSTTIAGKTVTLGYVIACAFCVLLYYFFLKLSAQINREYVNLIYLEETKVRRAEAMKKQNEEIKKIRKVLQVTSFSGLIDFKVKCVNEERLLDDDSVKKIKTEYCKLISEKLKAKYPSANVNNTDKIFFVNNNISSFEYFARDVIKLYKTLYELSKKKNLSIEILFSLWGDDRYRSSDEINIILNNINKLAIVNKIVANDVLKISYEKNNRNTFTFIAMGESKLFINENETQDINADLYYIKDNVN